ncbi:MAG: Holliday junction resolvase RuvX [Verrucomicrobium sp.]|nr:Holliday junction resolvase RuvX [Verrucomicrobium sp.]
MILALDPGSKRVGVALSDGTLSLARPLPFLEAEPFRRLAAQVRDLAAKEGVTLIVLGLPRNMDGSYGEAAEKARAFAAKLGPVAAVPIELVDERLTTVEASRRLHEAGHNAKTQREKIDSAAAAVLLQAYLDRRALRGEG